MSTFEDRAALVDLQTQTAGASVETDERRRPMIGRVPLLASFFLAGSFGATAALGADSDIAIKTFQFKPTPIEVKAGTRVTWANADDITHTVTSGTPENRDGQFNTPLPGKGTTFSFTFSRAGPTRTSATATSGFDSR